ncbi:MAG: hypothetical protein MUE44_14475 [Oscillatoriaceae cyanobacterium Prado104]|jgi:hypothetical protein|nr:hypothetical protein [Oscillatoriaceae cyanobacterium Prado104]
MRIEDSVWQGSFGYWQNLFIQQNILSIGHTAWNGFLNLGRGIVVCKIKTSIDCYINWSIDNVRYDLEFIAQLEANAYLQKLEIEKTTVSNLLQILATYEPDRAIVFLSIGNGQIDINLLQNLAISPVMCYEQVCKRWEEFQTSPQS